MSPAPLRLTVTLSPQQVAQIALGREIVMQASAAHAVVFEVAIALEAREEPPPQPAPVPVAPAPPARPAAVPPGSRWEPTAEDVAEARAVAERIERERRELGYTS